MRNPTPGCPACGRPLPTNPAELSVLAACPHCRAELAVAVFPAFGRGPATGAAAEKTTGDDDAACFFHPAKKAAVPCDHCGRFLCALCDLQIAGEHLCPTCVQTAQKQGALTVIAKPRVRWDRIVWWAVILPFVLCYMAAPVTGLAAAGLAVWALRKPPSRVVRTRFRLFAGMIAGILASAAATAMWIAITHR